MSIGQSAAELLLAAGVLASSWLFVIGLVVALLWYSHSLHQSCD